MCIEKNDLYLLDVVFLTHDAELVWTCHWEQQKYSFVLSVASSENIGWSYEDGHCLSWVVQQQTPKLHYLYLADNHRWLLYVEQC